MKDSLWERVAELEGIVERLQRAEYDFRCPACGNIARVNVCDDQDDAPAPEITNMTWTDACDELLEGNYVRRPHWPDNKYIYTSFETMRTNPGGYPTQVSLDMMQATDWESWTPEAIHAKLST